MNTKNFIAIIALAIAMASCSNSGSKVSYTEMQHYFIKNTVTTEVPTTIDNQADFDNYFGMAAVMGPDGTPTAVDFEKEIIVAISEPETDVATDIELIDMVEKDGKLIVNYRINKGEKMSYTMRPLMLLKVDNKYKQAVELVEAE